MFFSRSHISNFGGKSTMDSLDHGLLTGFKRFGCTYMKVHHCLELGRTIRIKSCVTLCQLFQ